MYGKAEQLLKSFAEVSEYQWSCNDSSKRFAVENPATGRPITTVQAGDRHTAAAAVEASRQAFDKIWRWQTRQQRCAYLLKVGQELEQHTDELALLLCLENGKPWKDAYMDVGVLIATFRYFGSIGDKLPSEFFDQGNVYSSIVYEPHGVCVGILPFNWPPVHIGGKVAPALAAGNTMIVKPGEQAPLSALRIVDMIQKVLPTNVVQAVPGLGPEVPQALIQHSLVQMVSLTGSTDTGIKAAIAAAPTMTATALELGGKNAFVVFEDADVEQVLRDIIEGAYFNKGEACTASTRIFVHERLYPDLLERLKTAVQKLCTGDGLDEQTHVGPVVSRQRRDQLLLDIEQGCAEGATLAAQGIVSDAARNSDGFYIPATLFSDITPKMKIARDEIFGPVAGVGQFSSEEEVIQWVNASDYGLLAGVYSGDFTRAMRVARHLDVGVVLINNYFRGLLGTPFGGVKGSGHGREHWANTMREWSRIKNIRFPSGLGPLPVWRGATQVLGPE